MGPASSSVVTLEIRSLAEQVRTRLMSISGYGGMDSPVFSLSCLFVFFVDELFFTVNIVETPESGVFLPGDKGSVYSGHYEEEILHPGRKAAC
jgi:hypothetical protein